MIQASKGTTKTSKFKPKKVGRIERAEPSETENRENGFLGKKKKTHKINKMDTMNKRGTSLKTTKLPIIWEVRRIHFFRKHKLLKLTQETEKSEYPNIY